MGYRSGLYCRVSTTDQDCSTQLRELREYACRRGWEITKEYIDSGISGSKSSRPALDELMRDCATRRLDVVLTYKVDRLGRSVLHLSQALATLDSNGVRFISTTQAIDTDKSNPTSRLLLNVLSSVAEFERELIRERTLSGIRAARAKGKRIGRPMKVFRRDEVVRLRTEEGLSWRQVSQRLGVPVSTCVDAYRCTETVPSCEADLGGK